MVARALRRVGAEVLAQRGHAPYPGQLVAAWAMLGQRLVEMDTGEGKTLALLMAAATAALAGVPVHVVTANDYLAGRDAEAARPLLQALGLSVGAIHSEQDPPARRAVYASDVVYCSPRELGFDHLRDQLAAPGGRVMRGLCLALIDEADSVLIDHARQPLVLARPAPDMLSLLELQAVWQQALALQEGSDYRLDSLHRQAELLEPALQNLPAWGGDRRMAAHMLRQALVVRHLLQRDRDYLVEDGQVLLIDSTTGRGNPGTQWSRGLQALASVKEGCKPPPHTRPAAQITLQGLFARCWQLGGASGTLRESRLELALVYGLSVLRVPPRQPPRRQDLGLSLFTTSAAQYTAVAQAVQAQAVRGRPVLVGTASVADSEALGQHLQAAGLNVQLLNARHGEDEEARLAQAGVGGVVTVTTQIAGRGADIRPTADALAAGGLHVLRASFNRSARLDRQLLGRSARNGEPGSSQAVLALNFGSAGPKPSMCPHVSTQPWPFWNSWPTWLERCFSARGQVPAWLARAGLAGLQRVLAAWDLYSRWQHLGQDRQARQALAYVSDDLWAQAGKGQA